MHNAVCRCLQAALGLSLFTAVERARLLGGGLDGHHTRSFTYNSWSYIVPVKSLQLLP